MHNPGVLLRDIRNMKKHNTLTLSMTAKDIGSSKDLKKARSSEQLINLKGFLDVNNHNLSRIKTKKSKISISGWKLIKARFKEMERLYNNLQTH